MLSTLPATSGGNRQRCGIVSTRNLTERTAGRKHVAGLYQRLERNPPLRIRRAIRLAERSQEAVKDPTEQTRSKPYRKRAPGPAHEVAGPQAGRVFVDLCDKLLTLKADHLAGKPSDADLNRLPDAEAAFGTCAEHGAANPVDLGVAH